MQDATPLAIRRAAVLLLSLDRETADTLLQQVPREHAAAIRDMVLSLDAVPPEERRQVICEFLTAHDQSTRNDIAKDNRAGDDPFRGGNRGRLAEDAPRGTSQSPLPRQRADLNEASERLIAECLCDELPQVIAVALAEMTTERASEVVSYLPAAVQAEVLERLVQLDPSTTVVDAEVRQEFQSWLNEQIERALHRARLAERLAAILEATHDQTRDRILDNVAGSDAKLAEQLKTQLATQQEPSG